MPGVTRDLESNLKCAGFWLHAGHHIEPEEEIINRVRISTLATLFYPESQCETQRGLGEPPHTRRITGVAHECSWAGALPTGLDHTADPVERVVAHKTPRIINTGGTVLVFVKVVHSNNKNNILVKGNRPLEADFSLAVCSPQCHRSHSVASSTILAASPPPVPCVLSRDAQPCQ